MTINDASKRHDIYETVYDILAAATLAGSNTVTVTASYIDDIQRFPQVVVYPVDIKKSDQSLDWTSSINNCTVIIEMYAKKAEHLDTITDSIDALTSLKTISGLSLKDWSEGTGVDISLNNKIHQKTITLVYTR